MAITYDTTTGLRALQGSNLISDIDTGFLSLAQDIKSTFLAGGKSIIATPEIRSSSAYGLLTTPDRVQNVVLPTDGLLVIGYKALWKSAGSTSKAAIFIGANQLTMGVINAAPAVQEATMSAADASPNLNHLVTTPTGLATTLGTTTDASDVTTGQILGASVGGGVTVVFAAAGTYDVSVQFAADAAALSTTVQSRKLWVRVLPF